jgi:hypothetical protein
MPIYRIVGAVYGSKYLGDFEASSREEAEEMALNSDAASVNLCHHCSSECEDPQIERVEIEEIKPKKSRKRRAT